MKLGLRIALCCALAAGAGMAQRHGGGGSSGGGFRGGGGSSHGGYGGGGFRGGGGFTGGGGYRGGGFVGGGYRGGGFSGGYRGGYGRSWGFRGYGGYYSPYLYSGFGFGLGYGYSPWYPDYDYSYTSYPVYSYPAYQTSPNVTVVYAPPAQSTAPVYVERPNPAVREYDEYGQQTNRPTPSANSAPPVYLIAFRDQTIRAAAAYWAEGGTLHYVTLDHEQKQAPLNSVDRDLSVQLNGERHVAFSLPASR